MFEGVVGGRGAGVLFPADVAVAANSRLPAARGAFLTDFLEERYFDIVDEDSG